MNSEIEFNVNVSAIFNPAHIRVRLAILTVLSSRTNRQISKINVCRNLFGKKCGICMLIRIDGMDNYHETFGGALERKADRTAV